MIRGSLEGIIDEDKKQIKYLYEECKNIDSLVEYTGLHKYELIPILLREGILSKELVDDSISKKLVDDKIIFISDTHLGSKLYNLSYIYMVYDYAKSNNINTIIHTGDLFQSTIKPVRKDYIKLKKQVNLAISIFDLYSKLNTYVLFGNHDLHLLRSDDSYLKELESLSNLNVLGFKQAYVWWNGRIISLHHNISKYDFNLPYIESAMAFYGHRHDLNVLDKKIYLSSLSDDLKKYQEHISKPGFLEVTNNGDEIIVENREIDPYITDKGLILRKKF